MATSQDGPTLVGAQNENTNSIKPLLVNNAGELLVTGGGGGGGDVNLDEVGGTPFALGQATMAGSLPVVIASDQSAIDVNVLSGGGSNASVGATGAAVPASATLVGISTAGTLTAGVAGHGTAAAALRVELPTDGTGVIATVGAVTAITNALPAGNNNIGDVDVASVTGNVTVVQPTGTNLHTVIDSGTITTVSTVTSVTAIANALPAGNNNIGDVDVASSALPTGASTLAEQQTQTTALGTLLTSANFAAAFGTAGTADSQVMSVQGIASMTPVQVSQATAANLNVTVASKSIYKKQLTGSAITVINTATDIAAGNFSGAPASTFTNNDAACPGALYAKAMLEAPDWAAAPVQGTVVSLWGILKDIDGTDDETDAPATTVNGGAHYFGSWTIAGADALQRRMIPISLLGITEEISIDFYIKNETAQNMNNDAGTSCVVKITPFTITSVG